jgi:hypothetical protein
VKDSDWFVSEIVNNLLMRERHGGRTDAVNVASATDGDVFPVAVGRKE